MLHSRRNLGRVYRSAYESLVMARNIAIAGDTKWGKPDGRPHFPYANLFFCTSNAPDKYSAITKGKEIDEMRRSICKVVGSHPDDDVWPASIMKNASHRDGSIYKAHFSLLKFHRITDRDETPLEPMMLSEPTDCQPNHERCYFHLPSRMMQIFSLKLAKIPTDMGSVQLYGYLAVRDSTDSLLNYIVNYSRDDPIIAQQGSPIEMTGPKRGISFDCAVLVEFDMRIKKGEKEEDDLQLIDGATEYSEIFTTFRPFTSRISGEYGAVDITLALVYRAVEATVEVIISKVQSGFNLSLSSIVFIDGSRQRIQLFRGIISESCGLRRYVIAMHMDSLMHMKFEVGQKSSKNVDLERYCSFKPNTHGCACQQIILELATISVKVTWSTMPI